MSQQSVLDNNPTASSSDPTEGQVYADARHQASSSANGNNASTQAYIIRFVDENRVLMESQTDSGDYRYERREQFDNAVGSRWRRLKTEESDGDEAPPTGQDTSPEASLDLDELIKAYTQRRAVLSAGYTDSVDHPNSRRAELQLIIKLLDSHPAPKITLTDVDGIGEETAAALTDAGLDTVAAVITVPISRLTDINGVGRVTAENLIEHAEELLNS
jgi:hypothetical protein